MIIHSASQLITIAGGPQRGHQLGHLSIVEDGAIMIRNHLIETIGTSKEIRKKYPNEPSLSAEGKVVMPGFVDPHTHLIWAGDRSIEFEMRIEGKTYMEILAAGGGILSTVHATRSYPFDILLDQTRSRIQNMMMFGTTTAEVKTGYGLSTVSELRQMEGILHLDQTEDMDLIPTFLGAHAIPPEFGNDSAGYTKYVCEDSLPALATWWKKKAPERPLPFVDVFCETGAFELKQSRQILEAARQLGFPLKIHADEFDNLGGACLAAELGATSADHLVRTSDQDIAVLAKSNTIAVGLPCTPFGLADPHYTPARRILEADGFLAIATDLNPGTAWCESMQMAIALACRYMHLTPAQAIVAATINAAAAINLSDKVGSLEPGKKADIIILNVDDYRHLGYRFGINLVEKIIKNGKILRFR